MTARHHEQTTVADLPRELGGLGDGHERVPVATARPGSAG